jgi:hypothetical protein
LERNPLYQMGLQRGPAADLWRNTLQQIPTVYGRMVYLAALRDPNSGHYEHFGLAQHYSEAEAASTLERSHHELFNLWLDLTLEEKKTDLDRYLSDLTAAVEAIIATWIRIAPYRNVMPARVLEADRQLFLADMAMLLELLRREHGVVSPDPDA